ncbi:MAG: uncharacterized protein JWM35_2362 [Verrucomicrobia bacterium]|nr:uncharacterized protein [Verrucomicrobiota bacterium]
MKTWSELRRVLLVFVLIGFGGVAAGGEPTPSSETKPSTNKPTTQSALDQALAKAKAETPITVQEGSTAGAIRGITAAPSPGSPQPFGAIVKRGALSSDAENPDGEKDPAFVPHRLVLPAGSVSARVLPSGRKYLKDLPNAQEIATKAASKLGQQTINIALLAQHKYMIADCLGVKVSAGTFNLKLGAPVITIVDEGVVARYTISHVSFSAFRLRFRPDVTDLAQPCHFSGRVELGGSADNVVLELRYNPVIDIEKCRVGEPVHLYLHIDIGSVHLNPLPPGVSGLEDAFKDMTVDALNDSLYYAQVMFGGTDPVPILLNQIIQTLDDVLEVDCPTKNSNVGAGATQAASSVASGATNANAAATNASARIAAPAEAKSTAPAGSTESAPSAASGGAFEIVPNAEMKGRLGRIVFSFPGETGHADTRIDITKSGSQAKIKTEYGNASAELMPGSYDVTINGIKVPGVTVQSHAETRMRVGTLHVNSAEKTRFNFYSAGGTTLLKTVYGEARLGFPVGALDIEVSGQRESVTIEDGKVTEY